MTVALSLSSSWRVGTIDEAKVRFGGPGDDGPGTATLSRAGA